MSNRLYIFIWISVATAFTAIAQDTTFIYTYGGLSYDQGRSVVQTSDGGFMLAGSTGSFGLGNSDIYVIKVDSFGSYLWSRSYGGPQTDVGMDIQQTPDKGYVILGYTNSYGSGEYDIYLVKIDSIGDTLWTKTYGGTNWEIGYEIIQTYDGGYAIIGETFSYGAGGSDVYLIKTDSNGDSLWTKTYGGKMQDFGRAIIELYDSTLIIAGGTSSFGAGGIDVLLLKLNMQGDSIWAYAHGGAKDDWARDVIMTRDTGLSTIGTTMSFNADYLEMYQIKTDSSGANLQWQWNWGQIDNQEGFELIQRSSGNYLLFGYTMTSGGGGKDFMLQEMDTNGWFISGKTYGGNSDEHGYSFDMTLNGGYVLFGTTNTWGVGLDDFFLIKTDSMGNDYMGNPMDFNTAFPIYLDTAISVAPVGINSIYAQGGKVRIYPVPVTNKALVDLSSFVSNSQIFSFTLFNNMGQIVRSRIINGNSFTFSRTGLASGIYSYQVLELKTGFKIESGKLMIIGE
jgi:hypothetical protein